MKRMVWYIVGAILLLVALVLFRASKFQNIAIDKSIEINAPISKVYDMVVDQNKFYRWSPFLANDPKLVYEVKSDGTQLEWTGGKDGKDLGTQKVLKADSLKSVLLECDIKKPFPSLSTFEYSFNEFDGKTVVIQEFNMKSSLFNSIFLWIFGVEKQINSNNQLGLDLLKKASEA